MVLNLYIRIENLLKQTEKQGMRVGALKRKSELTFHHIIMPYRFCLVFEEYANVNLDFNGPPDVGDAILKSGQDSCREVLEGFYNAHLFQTVVARRLEREAEGG